MADDELRRLERSTDPADVARFAQALARAGREIEAVEVAHRARTAGADLRRLLRPTWRNVASPLSPSSVDWCGLRAPARSHAISLGVGTTRSLALLDAGSGVEQVQHRDGLAGFDVVQRDFAWRTAEQVTRRFPHEQGFVVTCSDGPRLLDPMTGAFKPVPWTGRLLELVEDPRTLFARIDDEAHVAWHGRVLVVFDPRSGELLTELSVDTDAGILLPDPGGLTVEVGGDVLSYDRAGRLRWQVQTGQPIGWCDDKVFVGTASGTRVVQRETGTVEHELPPGPTVLVTREAILLSDGLLLEAFDRGTLAPLWSLPLDDVVDLVSTADSVLLLDWTSVAAHDSSTGTTLARVDLGPPKERGSMIPCAGRLVVPSARHAGVIVVE